MVEDRMLPKHEPSSQPLSGTGKHSPICAWRELALRRVLLFNLVLGSLAAIPISALAVSQGIWLVPIADSFVLGLIFVIHYYKNIPYTYRTNAFLLLIYLFSIWLFLISGSSSLMFLMACPIMTALLLGTRASVIAVVWCTLTILVMGYSVDAETSFPLHRTATNTVLIWLITLNFAFVSSIVALTANLMLNGLTAALSREHTIVEALKDEQVRLAQANASVHQLGHFDILTGLPNRRLLLTRIDHALVNSQHQGAGALVYLDLDQFRTLNEARGHASGDQLLCQVSDSLRQVAQTHHTVARLGGDEFAWLITGLSSIDLGQISESTHHHLQALRAALSEPITIAGESFRPSLSIGVSIFTDSNTKAEDLLREAEIAMYRAKENGRNLTAFFEPRMQAEVQHRLDQERDLALALDQNQFELYAQTQVDAQGKPIGAELLLRWQHPIRGLIPPDQFISIAEETGLIVPIGLWALKQTCLALVTLQQQGWSLHLSVNVSMRQFNESSFVDDVQRILQDTQAPASLLILEVTESLLSQQPQAVVSKMEEIAKLGVRFSIDDFGTGYSSLSYLQKMPLYELKIDKHFVQDAPNHASDAAIARLIISMSKHLQLQVVAEGVETQAQADMLVTCGCDILQGYLYAKPVPLKQWLAKTMLH